MFLGVHIHALVVLWQRRRYDKKYRIKHIEKAIPWLACQPDDFGRYPLQDRFNVDLLKVGNLGIAGWLQPKVAAAVTLACLMTEAAAVNVEVSCMANAGSEVQSYNVWLTAAPATLMMLVGVASLIGSLFLRNGAATAASPSFAPPVAAVLAPPPPVAPHFLALQEREEQQPGALARVTVSSRTVATQSQVTYSRHLQQPRFTPLPNYANGAWPQ